MIYASAVASNRAVFTLFAYHVKITVSQWSRYEEKVSKK
jgi:hypothetical protein